jgi:two-component system cell cycle response regulator
MHDEATRLNRDEVDAAGRRLEREETQIDRLAFSGGLAVSLVTVAVMTLLVITADHAWQHVAYLSLGGVPLAFGIFSNTVVRRMQVTVLHTYQSQLVDRLTHLEEIASKDELTGLFNRRHFCGSLRAEVERSRVAGEPLAILLVDIDGLKAINDEYGHSVGDAVIANVAAAIERHIRGTDVAARLGGDEFGVVMTGTEKRGAFTTAKRLWDEIEQVPMYKQGLTEVMVSVSIGVSGYPWGGEDAGEMMQWADTDMYASKISGRLGQQTIGSGRHSDMESLPDDYVIGI